MSWASAVAARLRGLFEQKRLERELDDEVRFHLEMQIEDNLKAGMSPVEARYAALRSFGAIEPMKETYRARRAFALVETMAQDIRYAARTLRKSPAFTTTAVATLALAIGVNTAMFSVVNAVLLRPLPYRAPEQLAMLWTGMPGQNLQGRPAYLTVEEWRRQSKSFADIAVLDGVSVTLTDTDGAGKITVARISPNFFPLLGVQPLRGRSFSDEEAEQRRRLALISHRFWQTRFGGSPDAIGASIVLDGLPSQIIGILPAGFEIRSFNADVWEPHTLFADWEARRGTRNAGSWIVVGRLRPNVTLDLAQVEMSAIARVLDEELPAAERNRGISVVPLSLYVVGSRSRLALWMLTGAVFCVLLIAAANIASVSLARGVGRAHEMAIRAALGASPLRIVRQLLAESVTLAAISGVIGSLLALALIRLIRAFGPGDLARLNEVSLDLRVLGWALGISLLTGILVGLTPAITTFRRNLRPSGEESGRSVSGGLASRRIRRALVVAEFALAIILMAGAGLLIRSWWHIEDIDPGFRPERVLSMNITTNALVAPAQRVNFYANVLEQVESLHGVESAGMIGDLFISSDTEPIVTTEGNAGIASVRLRLRMDEVSERLFSTLGTPLLRGRFFSAEDRPDSPPVAIVNDAMARHLWPGRDPVGRRFKFGPRDSNRPWFTIVGVVGDMRRQGLETEPIPQMFQPLAQNPSGNEILFVRTSTDDPLAMVGTVQAAVRRVERNVPLYSVTTLEDRLRVYLAERRFQTSLLIGFSVVALLMAAIGIYGLILYSVAARTQEIGIRMAIGAQAGDIFRMIVGEGLQLSVTGLAIGLVGALLVSRAGSSLLFGVTAADPLTFTTVSLLMTAVATAACYFPARRAMKVEPIVALRQQ
jgi:putative ABC transport system permease protein